MAGFVGWDTAFFLQSSTGKTWYSKRNWNWVPRIKRWVKMSHGPKICQVNRRTRQTNLLCWKQTRQMGRFITAREHEAPVMQLWSRKNCSTASSFIEEQPCKKKKKKKNANTGHTRCTWTEKQRGINTHTHHNFYHHRKNVIDHKKTHFSESFGCLFPDDWHPG